jgi:hypothetical protein
MGCLPIPVFLLPPNRSYAVLQGYYIICVRRKFMRLHVYIENQ